MFRFLIAETPLGACFRPLAGCGLFLSALWDRANSEGFRPLAGCGLFLLRRMLWLWWGRFPSPCGVWVVSPQSCAHSNFEPFPSPCGVWVVSTICVKIDGRFIVSVPLRGVGCFGKAAHSFWCNRKKNCQLCCFIVSYWQMFINSKLRNCKVPCEAHKTAT